MNKKALIVAIVAVIVGFVLFVVGEALIGYGVSHEHCFGGGTWGDMDFPPTCYEDTDYPFVGLGYTLMIGGVIMMIVGIIAIPVGVMELL